MPDLLLELLTEEIPARMQAQAADELRALVTAKLEGAGLAFAKAESFVTPRRLALSVEGLPLAQKDLNEERRGPRVGAPAPAVEGFLRSAGLATLAECEERATDRGQFYFAIIRRPGRATADVLPELLRAAVQGLAWSKSMRFPAAHFRWVRPLTRVVALFDGGVLDLVLDEVPVGDETLGHRFLSKGSIRVEHFADYREKLRKAHVVLDAAERKRIIERGLAREAKRLGVKLRPDAALLDEVTGLVEWPVVLAGSVDREFMELPQEVLVTSMRAHQKYFATLDAGGNLAPHFLVVANMRTRDKGAAIVAGNERVLRARLSDARFFWDQDRKIPLAARVPKLAERVFHAELGTVLDKTERVMSLVEVVTSYLPEAQVVTARRAAELAKADLSTGMVGEFPELQGIMGQYYATGDGEPLEVVQALAEHYAPLGPNDNCPTAPVSVALAIADKIDTLIGFFGISEYPTGSKDPYALRRAALGVIRLILENGLRLSLRDISFHSVAIYNAQNKVAFRAGSAIGRPLRGLKHTTPDDLLQFFADRLKVHLRERGVRHDYIAAAFSVGREADLVRLMRRVDALAGFLNTADGASLLTAFRRASHIVAIEERKDGASYSGPPETGLFTAPEEQILAGALSTVEQFVASALEKEQFHPAMAFMASNLRAPVDEFFTHVTVNCDDRAQRVNRLRLLARIRDTLNAVADFSLIEG